MERPLVQIVAHGPASAATRLWRFCGQLRVTVIAKATFTLVHQAIMKVAPPEPIVTRDLHHGNNPVRSVRLTDDLAPYLPGTDVMLTGHAHAPPGTRAPWVTAGVALYDKYDCIFEKYLDVRGEMGPDGIKPFERMPLLYERAFGGPGWQDNPFGVGAGGARGEPNIFYTGNMKRAAGFGPLSIHWPARKKLVSDQTRRALALPTAEIPEGFDWTYYHATPPDQRCAFLGGSEWLVLQGLRPDERRVRSRLPAARGVALVHWASEPSSQGESLELIADTVRVDADRGTCSLTWRKSFAVEDESQLSELRIMAAIELGGQPVRWPEVAPTVAVITARGSAQVPRPGPHTLPESPPPAHGTALQTGSFGDEEMATLRLRKSDVERAIGPAAAAAPEAPRRGPPTATDTLVDEVPPAREPPAPRPQPMILGAFQLAVFSPRYEEDPDDPLLSTLVIRDKSAAERAADEPPHDDAPARAVTEPLPPPPRAGAHHPLARTLDLVDSHSPEPTTGSGARPLSRSRGGPRRPITAPAIGQPPRPPGARLELADHAALAAALAETGAPRAEVLSVHDVSEAEWAHDQRRWSETMSAAAQRGDTTLATIFDAAYVAAWEAIRGPVSVRDYACLSVAEERGELPAMLAALKIAQATWRHVQRVWHRRLRDDASLAVAVGEAEAALR